MFTIPAKTSLRKILDLGNSFKQAWTLKERLNLSWTALFVLFIELKKSGHYLFFSLPC